MTDVCDGQNALIHWIFRWQSRIICRYSYNLARLRRTDIALIQANTEVLSRTIEGFPQNEGIGDTCQALSTSTEFLRCFHASESCQRATHCNLAASRVRTSHCIASRSTAASPALPSDHLTSHAALDRVLRRIWGTLEPFLVCSATLSPVMGRPGTARATRIQQTVEAEMSRCSA